MVKKYSRNIFALHSWAGIIAGLGFLLLSLTGSVLLFQHEIDNALYKPELEFSANTPSEVSYDAALATIREAYPQWNIRIRLQPDPANQPLLFDLRRPGTKMHVYAHPLTGQLLAEQPEQTSITMVALKLHYSLMAGLTGRIIITILGILFLLSLLTGLYMYRKKIWKVLQLQWNSSRRRGRKKYAFWHNILGTWSILFNLLLAVTGVYLCYLVVANGFRIVDQQELPDPPPMHISLDETLTAITDIYPGFIPSSIKLPVDTASSVTVYGRMNDDFFLFDQYANRVTVNPANGEIQNRSLMRNQPATVQIAAVMKPLHGGEFGGLWVRVIYFLIGLSVPVLSITGYVINLRKR